MPLSGGGVRWGGVEWGWGGGGVGARRLFQLLPKRWAYYV
jgi:hypothetical protein